MNESELKTALEELKRDRACFDYVMARAAFDTVERALKECGRSKGWFYSKPKEEQELLETLANELHYQAKLRANEIIEAALVEASQVKVDGLKSRNDNIKQSSSTEILDRVLGKPTQRQELTGKDGNEVIFKVVYEDTGE